MLLDAEILYFGRSTCLSMRRWNTILIILNLIQRNPYCLWLKCSKFLTILLNVGTCILLSKGHPPVSCLSISSLFLHTDYDLISVSWSTSCPVLQTQLLGL